MIFEALRGRLIGDSTLTASIAQRVYLFQAPAGQGYPDIIQYGASGNKELFLEGSSFPWRRRISFECRAPTYAAAHGVGDHVIRLLENFVGTLGSEYIHGCHLISDVPDVDETSALKRRIIDFRVTHSPA